MSSTILKIILTALLQQSKSNFIFLKKSVVNQKKHTKKYIAIICKKIYNDITAQNHY